MSERRTADELEAAVRRGPVVSLYLIAVALYLAVALVSVALLDAASADPSFWAAVAVRVAPLLAASIALGWVTRSWASLILAATPAAIAALFGYADSLGEDVLLWALELFYAPFYGLLIAAGVVLGRAFERRRPF